MESVINNITNWIKDYFVNNGPDCKAIVGISGGKDSTVTAALLVKALGKDRVIGVKMPQGNQHDQQVIPEYFQEGKDSPHEITPIPR